MRTTAPAASDASRHPAHAVTLAISNGISDAPAGNPKPASPVALPRRTMNQFGTITADATERTPVFTPRAAICSA